MFIELCKLILAAHQELPVGSCYAPTRPSPSRAVVSHLGHYSQLPLKNDFAYRTAIQLEDL